MMKRATIAIFAIASILTTNAVMAASLEVFHADSLAGPLTQIKQAYEAKHPGTTITLTGGTSRQLADRILNGEPCDLFAPSSPAIVDELVTKHAAAWSIVFSANEMVVITRKGNPHGVHSIADLAKPDLKFVRITGEKDLGTGRTVEFLRRAAEAEGKEELAQQIVAKAPGDP